MTTKARRAVTNDVLRSCHLPVLLPLVTLHSSLLTAFPARHSSLVTRHSLIREGDSQDARD